VRFVAATWVALRGGTSPVVVVCELSLASIWNSSFKALIAAPPATKSGSPRPGLNARPHARSPGEKALSVVGVRPYRYVSAIGQVEILVEPGPWRPRRHARERSRLVRRASAQARRSGAWWKLKVSIMTAYRQTGPGVRGLSCRRAASHPRSQAYRSRRGRKILAQQRLWLVVRVERGVYGLDRGGQGSAGAPGRSPCLLEDLDENAPSIFTAGRLEWHHAKTTLKKISPVPGGVGGLLQRQAGLLSPLERFQQILGLAPTGTRRTG